MRNIDYRALYQQVVENEVDPKKRKGTYDKKTHDERTKDAIEGNAARKAGQKINDPNKKSVAPVEPENLKVVDMGEELSGEESTVIDATDGSIEIVRQGAGDVNLFGI